VDGKFPPTPVVERIIIYYKAYLQNPEMEDADFSEKYLFLKMSFKVQKSV
jgi:hypothetical protein